MNSEKIGILMPTYNNEKTLSQVINSLLIYPYPIFTINDGSTDTTPEILASYADRVHIISHYPNRGKGYSLMEGFRVMLKKGFRYAITIDSDGQHSAEDIPKFIEKIQSCPDSMIVGARNLTQENMPQKNTFANRFSNFWFRLQTGKNLPDTQSGFRLYPLRALESMQLFTTRYESELEILVRLAWRDIPIEWIPISVYYAPPGERVSHFRPCRDFLRISILNAVLTLLAFRYFYPKLLHNKKC